MLISGESSIQLKDSPESLCDIVEPTPDPDPKAKLLERFKIQTYCRPLCNGGVA